MAKFAFLALVFASAAAHAGTPVARIAAMGGYQRTDRNAWVFGPALEIAVFRDLSIRGEAQLELGDIDDPFGPSNIRGGDGPHVNHVMFGPTWRPLDFARYELAVGAEAGVMVMHSVFNPEHFTKRPAAGVFVQAGHAFGPVVLALQLRVDLSTTVDDAGPMGDDVTTASGRLNFVAEVPIRF